MTSGPLDNLTRLILLGLLSFLVACSGDHLASNNTALSDFYLEQVPLDQIFDNTQPDYTATVGYLAASVNLHLDKVADDSTITVNGASYTDGMPLHLLEGSNSFTILVTAADGETTRPFNLSITRQSSASFAQAAYIKSLNTQAGDAFGYSVALDGNLMAIGAIGEDSNSTGVNSFENDDGNADDSGAVYVFIRDTSGTWYPEAYLKASNTGATDHFGVSLALSGSTLAVGANQEDSDSSGVNSTPTEAAANAGAVYIFVRDDQGNWSQQAYIKASNPGASDDFGRYLDLDQDTLVVGATREDSSNSGVNGTPSDANTTDNYGAAYVFERDSNANWSQTAYLKAGNPGTGDLFGFVSLSNDVIAVGAPGENSQTQGINTTPDNNGSFNGAVYIFARNSQGNWQQEAYIKSSHNLDADYFGISVSLSGDTLAVSAAGDDNTNTGINPNTSFSSGQNSGAVYIYQRDAGNNWSEQAYIKASNIGTTNADDAMGVVSLDHNTLAVGTYLEDSSTTGIDSVADDGVVSDSGAVYIFQRDGANTWSQTKYIKAFNTGDMDWFGLSVSVSGDALLVGALNESSNSLGIDGPDNDLAAKSGAAYLFR